MKSKVLAGMGIFFFAIALLMALASFAMDFWGAIQLDVLALLLFGVGYLVFWLRKKADPCTRR